jgi:hypothetical protein
MQKKPTLHADKKKTGAAMMLRNNRPPAAKPRDRPGAGY